MPRERLNVALLAVFAIAALAGNAAAAPPTQLSILRACADADTAAQCERVIEAAQIKQFPSIASRDAGVLRLKARGAPMEFRDQGEPGKEEGPGFRAYAFWDYWFIKNAAVLSVVAQAGDHYLLVDLERRTQVQLAAEPLLGPDGNRFAVVDFCETKCGNVLEVWRYDRDRIYRERSFKPPEKWYGAEVTWKDLTTFEIEYSVASPDTPPGSDVEPVLMRGKTRLLKFSDRGWTVDEGRR